MTNRIYSFDVLKFFAVVFIAVAHLKWQLIPQAYLGVELCFFITGFLISFNYAKYREHDFLAIMSKRLKSFYPFYIISILLSCLSVHNFKLNNIVNSLFFLPEAGITTKITNISTWFLAAYLCAFMFYIALIKICTRAKINYIVGIIVGVLFFAMMKVSPAMNVNLTLEKEFYIFVFPFGIIRAITAFGIGYLLCQFRLYKCDELLRIPSYLKLGFEIFASFSLLYICFHSATAKYDVTYYILASLWICSLSLKNTFLANFLESIGRQLHPILSLSMPIFIFHGNIILLFQNWLFSINNVVIMVCVYIIMVFAIAYSITMLYRLLGSIVRLFRKDSLLGG